MDSRKLLYIMLLQKRKNVINSKTYFFLLSGDQKNIKKPTKKIQEERKSLHFI